MPGGAVAREKALKQVLLLTFQNIHSTKDLVSMMGISGIEPSALHAITQDLEKSGDVKAPEITIVKDSLWVDHKDTGLRFVAYAPLTLQFQGKTWAFDREQSTDKNYFDLIHFLSVPKSASWLDWIVPSAEAGTASRVGFSIVEGVIGGLIGLIAGAIIFGTATILSVPVAIIMAVLGLVGLGYGQYRNILGADRRDIVRKMLEGKFAQGLQLTCSETGIDLSVKSISDKSSVRISRKSAKDPDPQVEIFEEDGNKIASNLKSMQATQKQFIDSMYGCKTQEEADKIMALLKSVTDQKGNSALAKKIKAGKYIGPDDLPNFENELNKAPVDPDVEKAK